MVEVKTITFGVLGALGSLVLLFNLALPHKLRARPLSVFHREPDLPKWMGVELDYSKMAMLVETRPEPRLVPLIMHFVMTIPPEWTHVFVAPLANIEYIRRSAAIRHLEANHKLEMKVLDTRKYPYNDAETVSRALTDINFYDEFAGTAEHLLFWQTDSIICTMSGQSINDWLEYDWVGAPWPDPKSHFGGNGGLSLRRISRIRRVLQRFQRPHDLVQAEDAWYIDRMLEFDDHNVVPHEEAKRFAVEGDWHDRPLGYHVGGDGKKPNFASVWLNETLFDHIKAYCPEIKLILPNMRWLASDVPS